MMILSPASTQEATALDGWPASNSDRDKYLFWISVIFPEALSMTMVAGVGSWSSASRACLPVRTMDSAIL